MSAVTHRSDDSKNLIGGGRLSLHVQLHLEHGGGKPLQIDVWLQRMFILMSNHRCLTS